MEASVWMYERLEMLAECRETLLTMPAVTELCSPLGAPTAMTHSPTRRLPWEGGEGGSGKEEGAVHRVYLCVCVCACVFVCICLCQCSCEQRSRTRTRTNTLPSSSPLLLSHLLSHHRFASPFPIAMLL